LYALYSVASVNLSHNKTGHNFVTFPPYPISNPPLLLPPPTHTPLLHIPPPPTSYLPPPPPNRRQSPPLRNHKPQPSPRNNTHHRIEIPRALDQPLVVPAKTSINIAAYRALIYVPGGYNGVEETGVELEGDVEEGEGDEGEGADVCESVGGY